MRADLGRAPATWRPRVSPNIRWAPTLLLAPLLFYMLFLFALPVAVFLFRSIDNSSITRVLPLTVAEIRKAPDAEFPNDAVTKAFALDLVNAKSNATLPTIARRLGQHGSGYQAMIMSAARAMTDETLPRSVTELGAIDSRFSDPAFWSPIKQHHKAVTMFYLLRALDLKYDGAGNIAVQELERAVYARIFGRTAWISISVTMLCLVIGFPIAYELTQLRGLPRAVLFYCVMFPFWISLLVRTAAWMILLQGYGFVNLALMSLHLISQPIELIGNRFGLYVTMVQVLLPFMVLPLYATMQAIPKAQLHAAKSLGARPITAFVRIFLPQCLPGVIAGASLVFIVAIGFYVTPQLVGGPQDQMISTFIAYYVLESTNWELGAAFGVILLICTLICFGTLNSLKSPVALITR